MIIITILFCIIAVICVSLLYMISKQKINLEKDRFYSTIDFESKEDLLDRIIDEEFTSYRILNLDYKEDLYITQEDQKEILTAVTANVLKRMTPAVLQNLSFIYNNINDRTELVNLISLRLSFILIAYVKETNIVQED